MYKCYRVVQAYFVVVYLLTGIYALWDAKYLLSIAATNLLVYSYLAIPFVASSVGVISILRKRSFTIYLWVCAIYWLFNTYEVVLDLSAVRSEDIFLVSMFFVSFFCVFILVVNKIRQAKQGMLV